MLLLRHRLITLMPKARPDHGGRHCAVPIGQELDFEVQRHVLGSFLSPGPVYSRDKRLAAGQENTLVELKGSRVQSQGDWALSPDFPAHDQPSGPGLIS